MPTMLRQVIREITSEEPDLAIIGETTATAECWSRIREAHADVVVLEVGMR
jgi:DNA-binding NarL/FixJ family response regulator